jgi:hypothetical protein
VTLREVVARLEEFADEEPIYAESASPTARAVVARGTRRRGIQSRGAIHAASSLGSQRRVSTRVFGPALQFSEALSDGRWMSPAGVRRKPQASK